jgi:hypothetical protein
LSGWRCFRGRLRFCLPTYEPDTAHEWGIRARSCAGVGGGMEEGNSVVPPAASLSGLRQSGKGLEREGADRAGGRDPLSPGFISRVQRHCAQDGSMYRCYWAFAWAEACGHEERLPRPHVLLWAQQVYIRQIEAQ